MDAAYHQQYNSNLLFGKPIECETFLIYPLTINEILDFDIAAYNNILSILSLDKKEIEDLYSIFDVDVFELVIISFYSDSNFKDRLLRFFSLVLREDIYFHSDNYFISESSKIINEESFYKIANIILIQNCIKRKKYQIKSKREKEYLELVRKAKEKYKNVLDSESDDFTLDIISSVCAKHPSINFFNVGELTFYQLIDQFNRLNYIDEYFINIKSLLAGAKDVKVNHWSRKIQK